MSLRDTPTGAIDLSLQQAESLVKWTADLNLLDAEIQDTTAALEEARTDALRSQPTKRPGGVGTEVGELTRALDGLLKQRESLQRDITAKQLLLQQLEEEAEAERAQAELEAAEAEIEATQNDVAARWAAFQKTAKKLRNEWVPLAEATQQLDSLPAGSTPSSPFPGDLVRAFEVALTTEPGQTPFTDLPRVTPRRLAITRSQGVGVTDTTGYARDMRSTGQF